MSQEKKHIDQQIREKLLQTEVIPPASVWAGLEKALATDRKAAIVLLYRRVGYAAAILLLGFLSFYFIRSERSLEPIDNKLAQDVVVDSLNYSSDSSSLRKLDVELREAKPIIAIKNDSSALPVVEKKIPQQTQKQQVFIAQQDVLETTSNIRESSSLIALNKISQGELASLYIPKTKHLSAIKANFLKMILVSDEISNQLAELSAKPNKKGWSIGLAYAPTSVERSSSIFTPNSEAYYDMASSEMSVVSEKDLPAYSGGVNLVYQISERWSFQSGIYYLKQGQSIENFSVVENSALEYLQLSASNVNSNSYFGNIVIDNYAVVSDNAELVSFTEWTNGISFSQFNNDLLQQFELIEIPFLASYKIINRKAILSVLAGINSGFLVGNRVYLSDYASEPIGKTEAINTLIYKSVFGISFEYPLLRKLYFNISPTFKYQLNNFNKNAILSEQLQYFEFKTGLNYRF